MSEYVLRVLKVDNRLSVTVNGSNVYDKYHDGNPDLNETVLITNHLQPRPMINTVRVELYNGNRAHKNQQNPTEGRYQIERDGVVIAKNHWVNHADNAPEGLVFNAEHKIVLT